MVKPGVVTIEYWIGLDLQFSLINGPKNLLQKAILYRLERILLGREDCRPGPKTTIYIYIYI